MKYAKQAQPQQIASEELTLSFGTFPLAHKHLPTLGSGSWVKRLGWIFGRPWRTAITVGFLDILGATFGLLLAYIVGKKILHAGRASEVYLPLWICFCTFLVLIYYLKGGYERLNNRRPEQELKIIVTGSWWAIVTLFTFNFMVHKETIFSRQIILIGYILSVAFIIIFRFGLREVLKKSWNYGIARENTIIVGDKVNDITWVMEHLHIQRYKGIKFLGYIAGNPSSELDNMLKYLGKFEDLSLLSKKITIDKIIFAMRGYTDQRYHALLSRLEECDRLKIATAVISRIFNNFYFSLTSDSYSGIFAVARREPAYTKPLFRIMKRTMDIIGSFAILLASLPVWIVTIICIKLDDGGPIFFRHSLVGKDGKPLHMLKFRTMVVNAQEILKNDPFLWAEFNKNYKLENDPRVNRVGRWLRKFSLDELPQVINIIKGDMSLVGPRPVKVDELERYGDFKYERIKIRPGLTGFWQVSGRCSTSYEERIAMDKFYMYKGSVWLDLIILLKTPIKVLEGHGAE